MNFKEDLAWCDNDAMRILDEIDHCTDILGHKGLDAGMIASTTTRLARAQREWRLWQDSHDVDRPSFSSVLHKRKVTESVCGDYGTGHKSTRGDIVLAVIAVIATLVMAAIAGDSDYKAAQEHSNGWASEVTK